MSETQNAPFLAPPPPIRFVGRVDLVRTIKEDILNNQSPINVLGLSPGIGKTALVSHIVHDEEVQKHFKNGVLWAGLGQRPNISALFDEWALALGIEYSQIADMDGIDARQSALQSQIGDKSMLLVIDDVWKVDDLKWFLLGDATPNCAYLITTRYKSILDELSEARSSILPVLSKEESASLLEYLAPEAIAHNREDVDELIQAVGGMPLAIMLMGKYLNKQSHGGQRRRIRHAIQKLHDEEERFQLEMVQSPHYQPEGPLKGTSLSLLASISLSYNELEASSQKALLSLSIHRPKPSVFDEDFPTALDIMPEDFGQLLQNGLIDEFRQTKEDISFYEGYKAGYSSKVVEEIGITDNDNKFYEMPNIINDFARVQLNKQFSEEEVCALHEKAATYYSTWLEEFENSNNDASPYKRMYRYVWPRWQFVMGQLIDHLGELQSDKAQILFANLYFDAFWWWGNYMPFPYCAQLLKWGEQFRKEKDWKWLDNVNKFHDVYPVGYYVKYDFEDKDRWRTIEEQIQQIRDYANIDAALGQFSSSDHGYRHLRVMTDIFLGHAYQYQDANDPRAEQIYNEALELLEKEDPHSDDSWNIPWLKWHLSDLYLNQGRLDEANEMTLKAKHLAIQQIDDPCQRDNEVISNTYRVLADSFFIQGDYEEAFTNYSFAVLYGWGFHTCPNVPNFYSVKFHQEMNERTVKRLEDLMEMGEIDAVEKGCSALNTFWSQCAEPIKTESGAEHIFNLLPDDKLKHLLHEKKWDKLSDHIFPLVPTETAILEGEDSSYYRLSRKAFLNILENSR